MYSICMDEKEKMRIVLKKGFYYGIHRITIFVINNY